MNIAGKQPGKQFFQKHMHVLYIDEQCVDGCTKVRFLDIDGKIKSENISFLVNSGKYKEIKILSYDFKNKLISYNAIHKIFKKQVKNFENYKIFVDDNISTYKRTLIVSPKQKIWTDKGYLTPDKIDTNDYLYILDHCSLNNLQPVKVLNIQKKLNKSWVMYDFEIENDHNFFGNGLLISNSLESEEVYNLRRDSVSEKGCIFRFSGMTNFTRYTPSGQIFYDLSKKGQIVNLPQMVNPNWDDKKREEALKDFGGESSMNYRIFIKGEVVEDGCSVFDMTRVRDNNYDEDRKIKSFEITKLNFIDFENIIIVDRPKNASETYISADIGESASTEIMIIFKIDEKYRYEYNITLYNLTDKEQFKVFRWLGENLTANYIGIDCSDGTGRAIFRSLEEVFPKNNLCWVSFSEKLAVGYEKNEITGEIIFKDGKPVNQEEYVVEWSIKHLKDLLYSGKFDLPLDHKLDRQLNSVISFRSKNSLRTIYECACELGDHLFQSMQIFSITQWINEFNNSKSIIKKKFCKSGVSVT